MPISVPGSLPIKPGGPGMLIAVPWQRTGFSGIRMISAVVFTQRIDSRYELIDRKRVSGNFAQFARIAEVWRSCVALKSWCCHASLPHTAVMRYGYPLPDQPMSTNLHVDGARIKKLRIDRMWPQDQLAEIAGLSLRTVQRIETGGKASFETLRALATAFQVQVEDLLVLPTDTKRTRPNSRPLLLSRVISGKALFDALGGAHAANFDHAELNTEEEADIIAAFLQDMHDFLDLWNDMEQRDRVKATFEYSERIRELGALGFWVFAAQRRQKLSFDDQSTNWEVATVLILRTDDPTIVRVSEGHESVLAIRGD
jgi:transcriptional regulator with XRE-family HTH domain